MKCYLALCLAALLLNSQVAMAGTKTVTFGWEDGTSTILDSFTNVGSGVSAANVTTGSEVDYGDPPGTPVPYEVTPYTGDQMLQVTESPLGTSSGGPRVFLAFLEHLDDGDQVSFSFRGFDPTDGRSPSILPVSVYAQSGDINTFAGYLTPLQEFTPGTGWLDIVADNAPDGTTFPVDPIFVFDTDLGTRDAAVIEARVFRPSAAFDDPSNDDYNFFIDDLSVTVTSANPLASITTPDGTATLVNSAVDDADFDSDNDVDGADFLIWQRGYDLTGQTDNSNGDADGSTVVDGDDLVVWQNQFGPPAVSAAVSAVPEPASIGLFGLGLGLISPAVCRRRRV